MEDEQYMEAPEASPLFSARLGRISLRDLVTVAGFAFLLLQYQFGIKAQVEAHTAKIAQVDAHLANTDRIIADEMVPRKEQEHKDTLLTAELAALQQEFVQYLMAKR
ncbi:MAG TPA: hypothetical protein VK604_01340 [Bryobacteraceae bacterium]|nr:hypothetical protein [Bryobacteraceae bacterium]